MWDSMWKSLSLCRGIGITLSLFSVVCLTDPGHAEDGRAEDGVIRVMSFNLRYGTANDGENHWNRRDAFVADVIRSFNPDLLGTQETMGLQADYLRAQLTGMAYIGTSRDQNANGEQCGVLYRRDRFDERESGQFWLSETPEVQFSQSWDSSLPRIATWVRLLDRTTKREFLFLNTHFDHRGEVARLRAAELIRRFVEQRAATMPVIVIGDFNCAEGAPPYKALLSSKRLADSFRIIHREHQADEGTFNGFLGTTDGARIDWILCSPEWKVMAAGIDRSARAGRYPSDHFPVHAVLQLGLAP
ncbi:MAG: endonuclease/exonuclease/phosphatase family protein [Planctomycetaceae bacterium]|nr:endonuclease/exonuclease/phosphatase family protein [Planctomycetaceae bacterium]